MVDVGRLAYSVQMHATMDVRIIFCKGAHTGWGTLCLTQKAILRPNDAWYVFIGLTITQLQDALY